MNIRIPPVLLALALLPFMAPAQEAPKAAPPTATAPPTPAEIRQSMASQLPPPPAGFAWKLYRNAVFLKPTAWNERERTGNIAGIPTLAWAMSPEEFSDTQPFEMGATVQIIDGPKKVRNIEAKKMALAYIKPFLDAHKPEEIMRLDQSTRGDFEYTLFRYKDAPPGLKPIIVHKFILGNNVTDTVHIFTFESPVDSWEENWTKYGTPFLGKVNVIPSMPVN